MKKLLAILAIAFTAFLFSCQEKIVIPDCEKNHYGTVTVVNKTGYNAWVDVTWGNVVENYEKLLYNNGSYKYNDIPSGSIEIWIKISNWEFNYENLSDCEDMTYTWYLVKSATAKGEDILMLKVTDYYDNVISDGPITGGDKVKSKQ